MFDMEIILLGSHLSLALKSSESVRPTMLIKACLPELAPQNIKVHKLSQKYDCLYLAEPILRIHFHTLLG